VEELWRLPETLTDLVLFVCCVAGEVILVGDFVLTVGCVRLGDTNESDCEEKGSDRSASPIS
jgi:hypothetical protein